MDGGEQSGAEAEGDRGRERDGFHEPDTVAGPREVPCHTRTDDRQGAAHADRDDPRLGDRLFRRHRRERRAADDPGRPRTPGSPASSGSSRPTCSPWSRCCSSAARSATSSAAGGCSSAASSASPSARCSARSRPTDEALVAARALQGIAGALLVPGSLAILAATFEGEARGRAVGLWTAWAGISTLFGPAGGGLLIEIDWRFIFWVNVPLVAVTVWLALRAVPESSDPEAVHGIDGVGILLSALGLAGPMFALIEQPLYGFGDPAGLGPAGRRVCSASPPSSGGNRGRGRRCCRCRCFGRTTSAPSTSRPSASTPASAGRRSSSPCSCSRSRATAPSRPAPRRPRSP